MTRIELPDIFSDSYITDDFHGDVSDPSYTGDIPGLEEWARQTEAAIDAERNGHLASAQGHARNGTVPSRTPLEAEDEQS